MPPHPDPPRLQIDADRRGTAIVLGLHGELDAATAEVLERWFTAVQGAPPVLVLDLHELRFVDSMGLNMLFRAQEWAAQRGVALRAVRAPVHVQRLLALAALDRSMGPFYADADAALRT